jgi:hypothetical protein
MKVREDRVRAAFLNIGATGAFVLNPDRSGEILMAKPLSAVPTPRRDPLADPGSEDAGDFLRVDVTSTGVTSPEPEALSYFALPMYKFRRPAEGRRGPGRAPLRRSARGAA